MKNRNEVKYWISCSPERNVQELKWQLYDMGMYLNEDEIKEILDEVLRDECRCPDDSGSCKACMELL